MSERSLEVLIRAIQGHEQIIDRINPNVIFRVYEGDLNHLYEPILNNDIILISGRVKKFITLEGHSDTYSTKHRFRMIDYLFTC